MQVPCSKQNNLAWYGRYCANAASADYGSRGIPPAWTIPVMRRFRNQRLGVVEPRREMKSKAFESLVASLSASVCGQGRVGKSRNGFGATRSSLCRRYVCRARPGQFHGTENQRWSVVSFSFRCGRHAAGSHCFGGGSEQNRRPSLHLEKVSQPQDRFTGWQLGTWEILLLPLNSGHSPIRLESGGTYRICGWFVGSVSRIQCIEQPRYRYFAEEWEKPVPYL